MLCVDNSLVLRYLVPFYFSGDAGDYAHLHQLLQEAPRWKQNQQVPSDSAVYTHLYQSLYGAAADTAIGSSWQYDLKNKPPVLLYTADEGVEPTRWKIREVQLHLFHTNVGLLWYELEPADKRTELSPDDLMLMQNRFKECNRTHRYFQIMQPRHSKEEETVLTPFDAAIWANDLLTPVREHIHYLNGTCIKNDVECPSVALVYNYVLVNGDKMAKSDLQATAFRMANGYTNKYRPDADGLNDAIHPFEDVCVYASRGGCGYFACVNEGNGKFFTSNFNTNIRKEYFFLYTLVLYQSYSLMNFARQSVGEHSSDPNHYNVVGDGGYQLDRFLAEFNTFLMKGVHTSVSGVQHHNQFYNYVRERLLIDKDIDSIRTGTEFLVNLQRIRQEQQEAKQQEIITEAQARRDKRLNFILAILSLLSLLAVFGDLDDLFTRLRKLDVTTVWQSLQSGSLWLIIEVIAYGVVTLAGIACAVILFTNFVWDKKKK